MCLMGRRFHRGFTAAEKTELWDRWKRGESLKAIGRACGRSACFARDPGSDLPQGGGYSAARLAERVAAWSGTLSPRLDS